VTDLPERLAAAGVRRAVIVDDVYDAVPLAADLAIDFEEWTNFFDDLGEDDREALRAIAPEFDALDADQLRTSDGFVRSLWQTRDQLRPELINPVFARYVGDMAQDREYVDDLQRQLEALGLQVTTAGRDFTTEAAEVDLVVIDLFLGSMQDAEAITHSKQGLKQVVARRPSHPPLVILMSRSNRLANRREEFRDDVGLQASAFRITRKAEIADGKLARLLSRLTDHYADSTKLAAFIHAWEASVNDAVGRTLALMRKLDLSDYAQVQQLLLSEEGEPTGSYVVDIFDRVLQHEIEREERLISAAKALDVITAESYPPPYVAGSPDLQQLVYRSLFQHHERLRLTGTACGVAFGDLLRPSPSDRQLLCPFDDVSRNEVLAVMTPACDLQRDGAKRVMLLVGTLKPLSARDWSYEDDPVRTPVAELDGERYWIKWNLKHVDMIAPARLAEAVAEGGLEVVARLRESHALELQQKMLSGMGRVGLPGLMPAAFPVRVQAYVPGTDKIPVRLQIEALQEDSTCFVGRPGIGAMRLVLTEDACEQIERAIAALDVNTVHDRAREALQHLQSNPDELTSSLINGLELPSPDANQFKGIPSPSGAMNGNKVRSIGVIARNRKEDQALGTGDLVHAGLIVLVTDPARRTSTTPPPPPEGAPAPPENDAPAPEGAA
jgi:hypothetical protein